MPPSISRPVAALIGLLAVAAALAAGHLVAGLVGALDASPYLAVGNAFIDRTPQPVQDVAKDVFGLADKQALLIGMAVVIAGVAAVAGLVSRRRLLPGLVVVAALGVVGTLAVAEQSAGGPLPPFVALVAGVATFAGLHRPARRGGRPHANDRRTLLLGTAGVAVGAVGAGLVGQSLGTRSGIEQARSDIGPLAGAGTAAPIPAGADFTAAGTPPFLTPNNEFYRIDVSLVVPRIRIEDWSLRITGMVRRELVLDFDDLRSRELVEHPITMCCVSNPVGGDLISTASFLGVPLHELLTEAGVSPAATQLVGRAVDGFTVGTPIEAVTDPGRDALLAIGMNGEPLPLEHGFPARTVVPGLYGYVSGTKWIIELEATTFEAFNPYWEVRGWARFGPVHTQSRIDAPAPGARIPAGPTTLAGVAWAPHTGIDAVQVRIDGGSWLTADLGAEVSVDTWRMWRLDADLTPGRHLAQVRAIDRTGAVQTDRVADVFPAGATGWHTVAFTAG